MRWPWEQLWWELWRELRSREVPLAKTCLCVLEIELRGGRIRAAPVVLKMRMYFTPDVVQGWHRGSPLGLGCKEVGKGFGKAAKGQTSCNIKVVGRKWAGFT